MAAAIPDERPLDTMKVRGRLGGVWLTLRLVVAAGSVLVGLYGDIPEPGSHAWFLPLFLFLAAVMVVYAVISYGRGVDADRNGVIVRNTLGAIPIPWRDLAAIEFKAVDSNLVNITNMYDVLVFQRHDGSQVTAEAPGGGIDPGEYLFELRERLLAMQSAALGYPHARPDRPSGAGSTDTQAAPPVELPSRVSPPGQPTPTQWLPLRRRPRNGDTPIP